MDSISIKRYQRHWSFFFYQKPAINCTKVGRLIEAADTPFHRILLLTMYATGARRAEAAHLKVSDIDSQRMVVHIREGKGGKDRDVSCSARSCSKSCVSIGAAYGASRRSGSSRQPLAHIQPACNNQGLMERLPERRRTRRPR